MKEAICVVKYIQCKVSFLIHLHLSFSEFHTYNYYEIKTRKIKLKSERRDLKEFKYLDWSNSGV